MTEESRRFVHLLRYRDCEIAQVEVRAHHWRYATKDSTEVTCPDCLALIKTYDKLSRDLAAL